MTTTLEQAAARLILRLAATPSQQVIDHAVAGRQALGDALAPLYAAARERWQAAANESARHVALVVRNNPERDLADILRRPDVLQALRENWQRAADEVRTGIIGAWGEGVRLGNDQAEADMLTLKMKPQGAPAPLEVGQAMLQRLLADADANAQEAGERMVQAVLASDATPEGVAAAVTKQADDQAHRARAGITTAGAEGYHAAQVQRYADAAAEGGYVVKVMWVTHFRPGTCGTCAALHGEVVTLGAEFDHFAHVGGGTPPKVFGALQGPPRHPNCGCRLVPFIDAEVAEQTEEPVVRTDLDGPRPETLRRYRESWTRALLRKIKRLIRRTP